MLSASDIVQLIAKIAVTAVEQKVDQQGGAAKGRDHNPASEGLPVCLGPGVGCGHIAH
jgi:hypothetical protein